MCLERSGRANRGRRAADVAWFYVDAAPIARRLVWDQSETLEVFGIERDLLRAGGPAQGIKPLLETLRANLGHLNELRTQVRIRSQAVRVQWRNAAGGCGGRRHYLR